MIDVLDTSLRLLHPFIPFVTEELWSHLKSACQENDAGFSPTGGWEDALIIAEWPEVEAANEADAQTLEDFTLIEEIVRAIRNVRSEKNVDPRRMIVANFSAGERTELLESQRGVMCALASVDPEKLTIQSNLESIPEDSIPVVVGSVEMYLPLAGMLDIEAEIERITNEMDNVQSEITRLEELLKSEFSKRAPAEIVAKEEDKLESFKETYARLVGQKEALAS
jgi:valyl-tRNA synthetase